MMNMKMIGAKKARINVPSQWRKNTIVSVFSQRVHVCRTNAILTWLHASGVDESSSEGESLDAQASVIIAVYIWSVQFCHGCCCRMVPPFATREDGSMLRTEWRLERARKSTGMEGDGGVEAPASQQTPATTALTKKAPPHFGPLELVTLQAIHPTGT